MRVLREAAHEEEDECSSEVTEVSQEVVPVLAFVVDQPDEDEEGHEEAVKRVEPIVGPTSHDICKGSKDVYPQNKSSFVLHLQEGL
jgi:hypothetical protein